MSRRPAVFAKFNSDNLLFYQPVMNVQRCSNTFTSPEPLENSCTDIGFGQYQPGKNTIPVNSVLRPRRNQRYRIGRKKTRFANRKKNGIVINNKGHAYKRNEGISNTAVSDIINIDVKGSNKALDISQFI